MPNNLDNGAMSVLKSPIRYFNQGSTFTLSISTPNGYLLALSIRDSSFSEHTISITLESSRMKISALPPDENLHSVEFFSILNKLPTDLELLEGVGIGFIGTDIDAIGSAAVGHLDESSSLVSGDHYFITWHFGFPLF